MDLLNQIVESFSLKIIGVLNISNSLRDYVNENYENENIKILGQLKERKKFT